MFPDREGQRRARQLPGPALPRLVPTHHTRHDRAEFPGRSRLSTPREKGGSTTEGDDTAHDQITSTDQVRAPPPLRRRIRLTLAEVRRLFNVRDQAKHIVHAAMRWSIYRREHQADAQRRHFRRRLKIQYVAL